MSVIQRAFEAPSADGVHTLRGRVVCPEGEAIGFFQIVHGMTEHIARYETFMREMAEAGWICFGHDHLGHGYTAENDGELGYIAKRDGWDLLMRDVKSFSDAVFAEYDRRDGMPYCLMGHSMGSFVARLAAARYVTPDRLIVMGTGGSNPAAGAGLAVIALVKAVRGERHISNLVESLAFGSYNKRFGGGSENDPKPWLSGDESVRKRYYADKFCTFRFTVSAMGDLIRLTKYANSAAWYKALPKTLPVLLVSGTEDPVGNYGKGVREVREKLLKTGHRVDCLLYDNARHEILNDFTHQTVKDDILRFCEIES